MPKKKASAQKGQRTLLLVGVLAAVLAIAAIVTWRTGAPPSAPSAAPIALPGGGPVPSIDPQVVARELAALAPELTPASAEMLAREFPGPPSQSLAEMGLVFASSGADLLEREEVREMGRLFEEVYAQLPPADRAWMAEYMRMVREGNLTPEAGNRGRQLLTQGVTLMPAERRQRLQALIEKSIRASLEARRLAKGKTPPSATPAAAPLVPHNPMPPNSPQPEQAGIVPSSSPSAPVVKDEAYWRGRMKEARQLVARLKKEVEQLETAVNQNVGSTTLGAQSRRVELTKRREDLALAERSIGEIEEEARKAGALPGWLRE
jgi:hypothetical protein